MLNSVDWSIYFDYGQIIGHFGQIKHYNGQIIIKNRQINKDRQVIEMNLSEIYRL
ncbi:hypothetical protein [Rossellomorea sp. BNER]|uniref:hypothetical protein n=1 Tax=Rossellomorea sp. BNER TaxID=2962031 RepID=UPI003AF249A8|nr:hypothetical protein [Rossellomorea sp. BNER]